jgi:hypothetical protein
MPRRGPAHPFPSNLCPPFMTGGQSQNGNSRLLRPPRLGGHLRVRRSLFRSEHGETLGDFSPAAPFFVLPREHRSWRRRTIALGGQSLRLPHGITTLRLPLSGTTIDPPISQLQSQPVNAPKIRRGFVRPAPTPFNHTITRYTPARTG